MAELLGCSTKTVQRSSDIPREPDGAYRLVDVVRWVQGSSGDDETDELIKKERHRKLKRENDLAEGYLIDAKTQAEIISEIADSMRDFGDKVARKNQLTGPQVQAMFNQLWSKLGSRFDSLASTE